MKQQYIETGRITGTHGIRGELRVQPWCDSPEDLTIHKTLYLSQKGDSPLTVISARPHKQMVILKVKGIDTVEAAEGLRDKIIYLNRDDLNLNEGQYLIADLLGCKVFHSETKEQLGVLTDVSKTGANDVWHVEKEGKEYLVPAIPPVIDSVDVEQEEIVITPLKGIFEDAD
jgi:16S rRNA processing protein RimM